MTFPETTTPHTDTVAAPQASGDDPFGLDDIPAFLRRTPGATRAAPVCSGASAHMERAEPACAGTPAESPELQAKGN